MKAVIEVSRKGSIFGAAAKQVAAARLGKVPDFHLSFESARSLFAELTPARLDLLDTLRRVGPCSVYALAKAAERNYSNVHSDATRLEERRISPGVRVDSRCNQCRRRIASGLVLGVQATRRRWCDRDDVRNVVAAIRSQT